VSYGYNGKILKINLTNREISVEKPDDNFYRTYMGGRNIGAYFLLKEMDPTTEPFSPDNVIIFSLSIISGVPVPGPSKYSVVTKSPLTNAFAESEAGGFWGPELKFAGFDAIVIKGKSPNPVYIWINNGQVEIKDAAHLWGKITGDTQQLIREELNDERVRIAQIGPAGENKVRYACVISDLNHANGRTGVGAVMGSKNLKAVVVRGNKKNINFKNNDEIKKIASKFAKNYKDYPALQGLQKLGTSGMVNDLNASGMLPTKNFKYGNFDGAEKISGGFMEKTIGVGQEGCYACPVRCKHSVEVKEPYEVERKYGGPEYETIGVFGSSCGINDIKAIAKANELCGKYGLDTISTGGMIAFAIDCYSEGLLKDLKGIELKYGDAEMMLQLVEDIARRKGLGDILAEGAKGAIKILGKETEKYAMHVKGQMLPAHEPRGKVSVGLSYAVAPQGADHMTAEHDTCFESENCFLEQLYPLGILEPLGALDLGPKKIRQFVYLQQLSSLHNVLCICTFTCAVLGALRLKDMSDLVEAATGWETSVWELMKAGERGINMARMFNIMNGFTKEDDMIPERFFEPLEGKNPLEGKSISKSEFIKARDYYYEMMNWSEQGIPRRAKLDELNIGWIVK